MTTRKKYSKEFKLDAISLVLEQGYSRAEAAKSLGINTTMLSRWIKEHQKDEAQSFRGNGKLTPEQDEARRLKEENRRLKMEKEIFKKGDGLLCQRNEIKYSFLAQHKKVWPIDLMCRVLASPVAVITVISAVMRLSQWIQSIKKCCTVSEK